MELISSQEVYFNGQRLKRGYWCTKAKLSVCNPLLNYIVATVGGVECVSKIPKYFDNQGVRTACGSTIFDSHGAKLMDKINKREFNPLMDIFDVSANDRYECDYSGTKDANGNKYVPLIGEPLQPGFDFCLSETPADFHKGLDIGYRAAPNTQSGYRCKCDAQRYRNKVPKDDQTPCTSCSIFSMECSRINTPISNALHLQICDSDKFIKEGAQCQEFIKPVIDTSVKNVIKNKTLNSVFGAPFAYTTDRPEIFD